MKKIAYLVTFSFLSLNSYAQSWIWDDAKAAVEHYENSSVDIRQTIPNNKEPIVYYGELICTDIGEPTEICRYNNSLFSGWAITPLSGWSPTKYSSSVLHFKMHFLNGKKEGTSTNYSKDGKIISENDFENGKRVVSREYYSNGKIKSISHWNGPFTMHGLNQQFDENGKLEWEANYVNGKTDPIKEKEWFEIMKRKWQKN